MKVFLWLCVMVLCAVPCQAESGMADFTAYPVITSGTEGGVEGQSRPDGLRERNTDLRPEERRHESLARYTLPVKPRVKTCKASGTSPFLLAASSKGEGILIQAFYRPRLVRGEVQIKWLGYLQGLWVDALGNIREDTVNDCALNVEQDKIVQFFCDPASGQTRVKKFDVSPQNPFPDISTAPFEETLSSAVTPLWEAGARLAMRHAADRRIFTFLDQDNDQEVDAEEMVAFSLENAAAITPFLGVQDEAISGFLGSDPGTRPVRLIDFVRGRDLPGLRGRTLSIGRREYVWKLGDIVHSSPVAAARPHMRYHALYADDSYLEFFQTHENRETVIYVGGNDGMLHAFTAGQYDPVGRRFVRSEGSLQEFGDELWAYVPQNLLPHLKWLASPDYTHTWFVDQTPQVVDAQVDGEWRTLLIGGFGMGGRSITVEEDFSGDGACEIRTFGPAYFCLDVTDPRRPRLLWERAYEGLGFSSSRPEVIKVGSRWFAVFGSGPTDYDGGSDQRGRVFVVDLATGAPFRNDNGGDFLFAAGEAEAFFGTPAAIDQDLEYDFTHDAVYIGQTYRQEGSFKGKLYRILTNGDENPSRWAFGIPLLDVGRPVSGGLTLATDSAENLWIYFGTGRYLGRQDRTSQDTQYLVGVKDPYFNTSLRRDPALSLMTLTLSDLFCADGFAVTTGGSVSDPAGRRSDWEMFRRRAETFNGWFRTLSIPGERSVSHPLVFGGAVLAATYVPDAGARRSGGDTRVRAFYYRTGTAFSRNILSGSSVPAQSLPGQEAQLVADMAFSARGSAPPVLELFFGEGGAIMFSQQSTGNINATPFLPPLDMRNGLVSWLEN